MLLRVVSKCTAPTVFWAAQLCLSSTQLSLCYSLSHFPDYTTILLAFRKNFLHPYTFFVCLFDCFLLWDVLISLKSAFYLILQADILSWLWHCLPFSEFCLMSCELLYPDLCQLLLSWNLLQCPNHHMTWLLQFLVLVLLNLCSLSSNISGMLQPGSSWSLNNATSGFSMIVGVVICPIYKVR